MNINIYNPYVREELYLMHHGILGQRWGKKNGPPYPLSAGAHSASEKKAGWRESLAENRYLKKQTKKLNNQDRLEVKATHKLNVTEGKIKRQVSKNLSNMLSGKQPDMEKYRQLLDERRVNRMDLEKAKNVTKNLLLEMSNKGYHISHVDTLRYANRGRGIVSDLLALTALGAATTGLVTNALGNLKISAISTGAGLGLVALADATKSEMYTGRKYKVTKDSKGAYRNQTVFKIDLNKDQKAKSKTSGKRNPVAELENAANDFVKKAYKEDTRTDAIIGKAKETPANNRSPLQKAILTPKGRQLYAEYTKSSFKNDFYSGAGSKYDVDNANFDKMIDKSYDDFKSARSEWNKYVDRFK